MNKAFVIADLHVPYQNDSLIKIYKKIIKDEKPTHLILLGDMIDCEHISKFTAKEIDSGLISTLDEIDQFKDILEDILSVCAEDIKIVWTLGNHEDRINFIINKFKTKGLHEKAAYWGDQLNLKKHFPNIKFIPYNKVYKLGKLKYTHGAYHNEFHTKKHMSAYSDNILYGHLHSNQVYTMLTEDKKYPRQAISMGCSCQLGLSYLRGMPSTWLNQFGIVYYREKGEYTLYTPTVINDKVTFNNKLYTL